MLSSTSIKHEQYAIVNASGGFEANIRARKT